MAAVSAAGSREGELKQLKINALQDLLRKLGAKTLGRKPDLINRILLWEEKKWNKGKYEPPKVEASLFPSDGFQPLEQINFKHFGDFTLQTIDEWFKERLAHASKEDGRRLFMDKFCKCVEVVERAPLTFVQSFCAAETTKRKDYSQKIVVTGLKTFPLIQQANCTCAAGEGWSAACKHIASLCYLLELFGGAGYAHQLVSKTSCQQQWDKPPPGRQVQNMLASDISLDILPTVNCKSQVDFHFLAMKMVNCGYNACMLKSLPRVNYVGLTNDHGYHTPNYALSIANKINEITESKRLKIPDETVSQSKTKTWHELRLTRITASNFKPVVSTVRTGRFSAVPAKNILNPTKYLSKAMKDGLRNEAKALQMYVTMTGNKVKRTGLHIDKEYPFLAASPDAISCDNELLVEVKCPSSVSTAIVMLLIYTRKKE